MVVARPPSSIYSPTAWYTPSYYYLSDSHSEAYRATSHVVISNRPKIMSKLAKGKMDGASHAEVFNMLDLKQRDQVVKMVKKEEVSLGMVDPTTGRLVIVPVAHW